MDAAAAKILGMNPWVPPNQPGSFTTTGPSGNYTWESRSRTFFEDYSGRLDHQVNDKLKLFGSYTYNHQNGIGRPTSVAIPVFDGANGNLTPFTEQNYSIGASYLISPTTFNEFRIGYYRARNDTFVPSYDQGWAQKLGIPNVSPLLMPSFSSTAASGTNAPDLSSMYGLTVPGPTRNIRETLSLRDDFSKMMGAHAFKMGYEILDFRANYCQLGQPSGVFPFDQMTAALQPNGAVSSSLPGNPLAALELGAVRSANFSTYTTTWLPRDTINSLYFQDDWKASRNLTFNLGLRWSTESPFHTAHDLESNFSPTTVDPLTGKMGAIVHPTGGLTTRAWPISSRASASPTTPWRSGCSAAASASTPSISGSPTPSSSSTSTRRRRCRSGRQATRGRCSNSARDPRRSPTTCSPTARHAMWAPTTARAACTGWR